MSKKRIPIYDDFVIQASKKLTVESDYPQCKDYDITVAQIRTAQAKAEAKAEAEKRGEENGELKYAKYTPEQVHSNVFRSLQRLSNSSNGPIIRYRKYYLPNDPKYLFEKLSEEFFEYLDEKIKVEKRFCYASYNAGAFYASSLCDMGVGECIELCLDEYLYAVLEAENVFYVIVKYPNSDEIQSHNDCIPKDIDIPNKNSKEFVVLRALESAINRLFDKQHIRISRN